MASTRLILFEKQKKKDGTAIVYAQVHLFNKSIRINTGVSVVPEQFDRKKGRIKGNSKELMTII